MTFGFSPYAGAPFADVGDTAQGISVQLTGVSSVGVVGTVAVGLGIEVVLTGVNAVGQLGNVTIVGNGSVVTTGVRAIDRKSVV